MVRTQIQLPERDYKRLRELARRSGVSVAEMVRRCIADRLAADSSAPTRAERIQVALSVCGKYEDSEGSNIAEDHDAHLAKAYSE